MGGVQVALDLQLLSLEGAGPPVELGHDAVRIWTDPSSNGRSRHAFGDPLLDATIAYLGFPKVCLLKFRIQAFREAFESWMAVDLAQTIANRPLADETAVIIWALAHLQPCPVQR